jgi:hypothetical protein
MPSTARKKPSSEPAPLLALGAHPDDVEFGCGAVLVQAARAGRPVHVVVCTRGEAASHGTPAVRAREARRAAARMGASFEFLILGRDAGLEARPDAVIVLLQDRDGQPLRGLKVTATLLRPATEQGRSVLTLTETAPGQYSGPRAGLSGVWEARIDATGGGHSFMAERRLTWP